MSRRNPNNAITNAKPLKANEHQFMMKPFYSSPHEDMLTLDRLPVENEYRRLRHLTLQKTGAPVSDELLCGVLPHCTQLESVTLSGVEDLSDRALAILASTSSRLVGANLNGCKGVTDIGIISLATSLPLQWLHLNGTSSLTDVSISAIAKSCPRIVELELCFLPLITAVSVRDVWEFCKSLRCLRLASCRSLTDKAFPSALTAEETRVSGDRRQKPLPHRPTTWLEKLPPLILPHSAENLRILDLRDCAQLTDVSIAGVVRHAPKIQNLTLSGCSQLTDKSLESISLLGEHLDFLIMANVPLITDVGVVRVSRSCLNLRCIDLSYCRHLTDMSIFELCTGPRNLRRISVIGVGKLTDNAVYFLAEHSQLDRLHLSYCERISIEAVHFLLKRQKNLQHLTMTGVPSCMKRRGVWRFSDMPPESYTPEQRAMYNVFTGRNIGALLKFLDKEEIRREKCEAANILFHERSDDETKLY